MAVWIDEQGMLVRPAEGASIEANPFADADVPEGLDDRLTRTLQAVKDMTDQSGAYRAAIVDWAEHGAGSAFAMTPDQVIAASKPQSDDHARAAACFELGKHLFDTVGHDAAVPWWQEAHRLHRENWTYKRQAWTLVTTPEGEPSDLMQGPNDVYDGSWLEDVEALGGGAAYNTPAAL